MASQSTQMDAGCVPSLVARMMTCSMPPAPPAPAGASETAPPPAGFLGSRPNWIFLARSRASWVRFESRYGRTISFLGQFIGFIRNSCCHDLILLCYHCCNQQLVKSTQQSSPDIIKSDTTRNQKDLSTNNTHSSPQSKPTNTFSSNMLCPKPRFNGSGAIYRTLRRHHPVRGISLLPSVLRGIQRRYVGNLPYLSLLRTEGNCR